MTSEPLVSVVIPARNAGNTIAEQLEALAGQRFDRPWEVIVADNGSDDDTALIVHSWRDRLPVRMVDVHDRLGINIARNGGIAAARGELVLLTDADDVVRDGWLAAMTDALATYDVVGGPVNESLLNDPTVRQWRDPWPTADLQVGFDFLPYPIGTNCGFRRSVWESVGGFDDAWIRGSSEVEFFWRTQLAGFSIGFVPEAVVAYRFRGSLRELARQTYRHGQSAPRLYATFRRAGMPRMSLRRAIKLWAWFVWRTPDLFRSPERRVWWIRNVSCRLGFLTGSIRQRVFYL